MRVVIAPDSFKECLAAADVCRAVAEGWRAVYPDAELDLVPMADGGEGTVDALVAATGGEKRFRVVTGPLGDPVEAAYGILPSPSPSGKTAVIEMASASGLALVPPKRRDPLVTTTRGTGELIRDALDHGATTIIVGIGGSATNDGGAGMAQALGYSLSDANGLELPPGGAALARLAHIEASGKHPGLARCAVRVACDVQSPLCGPAGASRMFGPQKGATPAAVEELDAALHHFAGIVESQLGVSIMHIPGGGAAGGLGAGLVAFTGARLESGVAIVAEACRLGSRMVGADLVITGEGRMDAQTVHGKTPVGVARLAREQRVPVIAFTGALGSGWKQLHDEGIAAIFPLADGPISREESLARTCELLRDRAESVARLWRLAKGGAH